MAASRTGRSVRLFGVIGKEQQALGEGALQIQSLPAGVKRSRRPDFLALTACRMRCGTSDFRNGGRLPERGARRAAADRPVQWYGG
uniref:Uncharacterized protein n=1 Tax=Paenibacillus athensensis TaxID=1967502 RepID=A0A4Y8Q790_9BACL